MVSSKVIVVHADEEPIKGVVNPSSNQIYKNPSIQIIERAVPDPGPNDIRIQMLYVGLCGTDVHLVETNKATGYIKCSAPLSIPPEGRVIGHEGVGRVLKRGSQVQHIQVGDIVTLESILVCNVCDICKKGNFNQCRNAKLVGLEVDGIMGTTVNIHASLAHNVTSLIKSDKDLHAVACIEPAGVAFVGCQNSRVSPGDHVVIFGAGPIGVITGLLCKNIFGVASVHIVEPVPFRREHARKWIKNIYDVDEFFETFSSSVDVVIEASGHLNNVNRIFRKMNANGRISLLARSGEPLILNAVDHMITNEIKIKGSRGHLGGAFIHIIELYKQNRLPLDEIVTDVTDSLDELKTLLQTPEKILTENCKVLTRISD